MGVVGDLEIGDEVVSLDGNGTVESIAVVVDPQPMYNLTVDEAHTFFVGDGDWLVHNTGEGCDFLLPYREGEGHHVYAKASFLDPDTGSYIQGYDPGAQLSIPSGVMDEMGFYHPDFTSAQRSLFKELTTAVQEGGVSDMLTEHTRVAYQALLNSEQMPWGVAVEIVDTAYNQLLRQGLSPIRIPWTK